MKKCSRIRPRLAAVALATACTVTILGTTSPAFACEAGHRVSESAEYGKITGISRTSSGIEIAGIARTERFVGNPINVGVTVDGVDAPRLSTSRLAPGINRDGRFNIAVNATPGAHAVCIVSLHKKPLKCATITADNEVGTLKDVSWAYVNYRTNETGTSAGFYRQGEVLKLRVSGALADAHGNPRGITITVNGITVPQDPPYEPERDDKEDEDEGYSTGPSNLFAANVRAANTSDNEVCVRVASTNNLIECKRPATTPNTD